MICDPIKRNETKAGAVTIDIDVPAYSNPIFVNALHRIVPCGIQLGDLRCVQDDSRDALGAPLR